MFTDYVLYRGEQICYYFLDMKKAVISTGGKQYLVSEGELLHIELLNLEENAKTVNFDSLLLIDGDKVQVGTPVLPKVKVEAEIMEADVQADKVTSIRYKAKKRVHTVRGHRQHHTIVKISKIS